MQRCDAAYRTPETLRLVPGRPGADFDAAPNVQNSMLSMGGTRHRRYRGAGAAVVRAGKGPMVDPQLDRGDGPRLIDTFVGTGTAVRS